MTHNIGSVDKVIRVLVGVGLLSLIFVLEGNARWLGLIGIMPLFTVATGWCPAYSLFGMSTAGKGGK